MPVLTETALRAVNPRTSLRSSSTQEGFTLLDSGSRRMRTDSLTIKPGTACRETGAGIFWKPGIQGAFILSSQWLSRFRSELSFAR
jgi:hypothetical protein